MVMDISVPWLPVVISAVVGFLIGWVWHSDALFGKMWRKEMGITDAQMNKAKKQGMKMMMRPMIVTLITLLIMAWVISAFTHAIGNVGVVAGMCVAFWSWIGYVATIGLSGVSWENRSMKMFWISSLHWLVIMLVTGAIVGFWM